MSNPIIEQPTKEDLKVPDFDFNHMIKGEWEVSALDVCKDPKTFMLGWCCPCVLSWKIAKSLGENPLLYCLGSFILPITPLMRQRTREKFGMTPNLQEDVCMHAPICNALSLCQVENEINARAKAETA